MEALLLSCAWLAVVSGLLVRALTQQNLFQAIALSPPPVSSAPRAAFIVPARDEESNIRCCLDSLFIQDYPADRFDVLVVNDHSADRTVSIAKALARHNPQLRVLSSPPLPPHWIGKSHACWVGACAVSADTEWLCFLDADVQAEPALLASAIAAATADRLDLLSLSPRQRAGKLRRAADDSLRAPHPGLLPGPAEAPVTSERSSDGHRAMHADSPQGL